MRLSDIQSPYGTLHAEATRKTTEGYGPQGRHDVEVFQITFDAGKDGEDFIVNGVAYQLSYVIRREQGQTKWHHHYRNMRRGGNTDNPTPKAAAVVREFCSNIADVFDTESFRNDLRREWYMCAIDTLQKENAELTAKIQANCQRILEHSRAHDLVKE
jgi:hypothetical protein